MQDISKKVREIWYSRSVQKILFSDIIFVLKNPILAIKFAKFGVKVMLLYNSELLKEIIHKIK